MAGINSIFIFGANEPTPNANRITIIDLFDSQEPIWRVGRASAKLIEPSILTPVLDE